MDTCSSDWDKDSTQGETQPLFNVDGVYNEKSIPTHPDKKTKKREIVRKSEERRRKRIKERYEELKSLLSITETDKKITQEELIQATISKMKELMTDSPKATIPTTQQLVPKSHCISPLSSVPIETVSSDDIPYIFTPLEEQILSYVINADLRARDVWSDCVKLHHLAKKSQQNDLLCRSLFLLYMSGKHKERLGFLNQSYSLFSTLTDRNSLMIYGKRMEAMMAMALAIELGAVARWKEAKRYWNEAMRACNAHAPSKLVIEIIKGSFSLQYATTTD
jgi:hypothetical protein